MKKALPLAVLFVLVSFSTPLAQTWTFTQPNGQPGGTATYSGPSRSSTAFPPIVVPHVFSYGDAVRQQQEQKLRELQIQRQQLELEQTRRSLDERRVETTQAPRQAQKEISPEIQGWFASNPWYFHDKEMEAYADAMGKYINQTEGLTGVALLDRVREEVVKRFPERFTSASTAPKRSCRDNCKEMYVRGELKPGMTVGRCIKIMCK